MACIVSFTTGVIISTGIAGGDRPMSTFSYDPKRYDPKCYELAEHFLRDDPISDHPKKLKLYCHDLARIIQHAVEDWFNMVERK